MKYNASQTACETFSYGEVEDYTVVITGVASSKGDDIIDAQELGDELPTSISVFPNPTSSTISVKLNNGILFNNSIVKIYNSIGVLVKTETMDSQEKQINVSELPAGVYIISIDDPKEPFISRFVKK